MLPALMPFCVPPAEQRFLAEAGLPTVLAAPALPFEKKIRKSLWAHMNWSTCMHDTS
ncbi:MAG: hypothetical protein FD129_528 [bacterium]|nr:MAG: hypothetical protein FD129_528 [bacterium]